MNCWKSININQYFGSWSKINVSIFSMIVSYILFYIPFSFFVDIKMLNDNHFLQFLLILLVIYPLHKCLHVIPLIIMRENFTIIRRKSGFFFPFIQIKIMRPIGKRIYISSLLMPFLIINSILIICLFQFPLLVHYLTFLLSFHIGICVSDFISLASLVKSPPKSYIEESDEGFEILTITKV